MRLQMRIFYFMVFTACACAQAFAMSAAVCRVDCTSAKITAVSDGDVSIKLTNLDTGKPVDTKSMYVQKRRTSPKTSAIELGELMPSTRYAFTLTSYYSIFIYCSNRRIITFPSNCSIFCCITWINDCR